MQMGFQSFLGELSARAAANEQQLRGLASLLEMLQERVETLTTEIELDRAKLEALRELETETTTLAAAIAPQALVVAEKPLIEDFTAIRGIDRDTAQILAALGLTHYADIAALNDEDVDIIGARIGDRRRICKENWIEQAALLARGIDTDFVSRTRRGLRTVKVESHSTPASNSVEATASTAVVAETATPIHTGAEIIDLAARRVGRAGQARRLSRVASIAASLVACFGLTLALIALPPGIGSQIMHLGNCNSATIQFDEACTALAWMML